MRLSCCGHGRLLAVVLLLWLDISCAVQATATSVFMPELGRCDGRNLLRSSHRPCAWHGSGLCFAELRVVCRGLGGGERVTVWSGLVDLVGRVGGCGMSVQWWCCAHSGPSALPRAGAGPGRRGTSSALPKPGPSWRWTSGTWTLACLPDFRIADPIRSAPECRRPPFAHDRLGGLIHEYARSQTWMTYPAPPARARCLHRHRAEDKL